MHYGTGGTAIFVIDPDTGKRRPSTVEDVVLAANPDDYVETLLRWARAVWASWRAEHPRIGALVSERLPSPDRRA